MARPAALASCPPRRPSALGAVKATMLVTDLGFALYWATALLGLIPAELAYKDYTDPVMTDWNYSFLPLDAAASATGLAALVLARRGRPGQHTLMTVSLTLTSTAGLQAVAFWALRGDWSPTWWIPNLFLLLFPVPALYLTARARSGPDRTDSWN